MRRALLALALVLAGGGVARAQFVTSGDKLSQPAAQNVEESKIIGRLYATFGYYGESSSGGAGYDASPDRLVWGDLRGRVEADHIKGSAFDVLGDLRIRFTPHDVSTPVANVPAAGQAQSRGWIGGNEYDLREAFVRYGSDAASFSVGRLVLRDLDAMTVDGARFAGRSSASFEYGVAAGLFPNPYSRSFSTDYKFAADDERGVADYPAAAGAWAGYRLAAFYGAVGAGAIFPRNTSATYQENNRTFLTASGYARVSPTVNFFHYGVLDVSGDAGTQLTSLQLGGDWMVSAPLRIEVGYSHMSTYAIETYFRNYLETVLIPAGGVTTIVNNLDVARMAADEGRLGANYAFLKSGLDVFGQVRYRRRDTIDTAATDANIAALPAETQIDVSAGVRKKAAIADWDLGANAAYITGDRTTSFYAFVRGAHSYLEERMDVDLDAGYISYEDACATAQAAVCGQASGSTIRAGGQVVFRQTTHWMYLGDLHIGYNTGSSATTSMARGSILETIALLRAQYSF
jgi:hypothetical protein